MLDERVCNNCTLSSNKTILDKGLAMSQSRIACGMLSLCLSGTDHHAGCRAADLSSATIVEKGALTYGVAATFSPFEYQKDGKLTGFDIDMIGALSKKLAAEAKPMNMEFKGLSPRLQGGRIDLINSAMYVNEQRAAQVDFIPYLRIGSLVVVQAANPSKDHRPRQLPGGKTIAVTLGGIQETYARQDDKRCRDGGLAGVTGDL